MLRFVLQLLRSLAVLITLLLQSWREKRFGSAWVLDKLPRGLWQCLVWLV